MRPPDPAAVGRVRTRLVAMLGEARVAEGRLGLAVSGGPDSLALALLCGAAMPGRVLAATVDHGLSPHGAAWADAAAAACARLDLPHHRLTVAWPEGAPTANRQARARAARYDALGRWMLAHGLTALATGHQADDQAETLLMRLDRGAGLAGLAGVRAVRRFAIDGQPLLAVRPLLDWRRAELAALVDAAGLDPVDDPANRDPAHDRSRVRAVLDRSPDFPDRQRLAQSAHHLGEADAALDWVVGRLFDERVRSDATGYWLDPTDLPRELQRRLLRAVYAASGRVGDAGPRGDGLARALDALRAGLVTTLDGMVLRPGPRGWNIAPAPPRRA